MKNSTFQVNSWEEIHKWECKLIKKAGPHVPSYPLRMIANVLLKVKVSYVSFSITCFLKKFIDDCLDIKKNVS